MDSGGDNLSPTEDEPMRIAPLFLLSTSLGAQIAVPDSEARITLAADHPLIVSVQAGPLGFLG